MLREGLSADPAQLGRIWFTPARVSTCAPGTDPTGDTFSDKWSAHLRYQPSGSWFWVEYRIRHNGEEDLDVDLMGGPLGDVLPSFTVHRVAGGFSIGESAAMDHRITFIIDNLTDELYAEFSNATFFRPQPERSFIATYNLRLW